MGSYATATLGTNFLDINTLGRHSYENSFSEKNGIVYTCRGGHIDIAHLRIGADNVRYLYNKIQKHLINNDSEFTFKSNIDPSMYFVKLQYPRHMERLTSQKQRTDC